MTFKPINLLGIPWDDHSSYMRGPAQAPPRIRTAFACPSSNQWTESGIDLGQKDIIQDAGDLVLEGEPDPLTQIQTRVTELLDHNTPLFCLGGDHAVTFPVVKAVAQKYDHLNILHFDAHPDLYDILDNDRFSHACPFARIMETGRIHRLVQVGIRCMTGHQKEQAEKFGVEVNEIKDWQGPPVFSFDGLGMRDIMSVIHNLGAKNIVGADLVEYNPMRDPTGLTAMTAAKIMKELMGKMIAD